MSNVKNGAKVPKNVAFAILVILTASKNNAKWIPSNAPAHIVILKFALIFIFPWGFTILNNQSTTEAINILQNEIEIAPTPVKALPIIGDVLTDKSAIISKSVIFLFIIIIKIIIIMIKNGIIITVLLYYYAKKEKNYA